MQMSQVSKFNYILDTNVFIEAYNSYYAFDLVPKFWQMLIVQAQLGNVRSIDHVLREINSGDDDLQRWVVSEFNQWFENTEQHDIMKAYSQIIDWSSDAGNYTDKAKNEFAQFENADAWVVAYALVAKSVVVTLEKLNDNVTKRIPIPNACEVFNIKYINTFEMMRQLHMMPLE